MLCKRINNYFHVIRKEEYSAFISPLTESSSKNQYLSVLKFAIQFIKDCKNLLENKAHSENLFEEYEDYEGQADINQKFDLVHELDVLNVTKSNLESKRLALDEFIVNNFKVLKLQIN